MKKLFFSRFLSLFMMLGLLLTNIPLAAIADPVIDISSKEDDAFHYVYLGEELSNLPRIVEQASAFDEDQDSLLHAMKKYMDEGFVIAGYEEVVEALEYAQHVIERTINRAQRDTAKNQLQLDIAELIAQITDGALSVDQASLERGCMPKDCCSGILTVGQNEDCQGIINSCRTVLITKDLKVCGKALFKCNVNVKKDLRVGGDLKVKGDAVFKDDVTFKDEVVFEDPVLFEDNVTIEGALSVTDLVVLSCVDNLCINTLSVTDLAVASCVDNLCVNTLSVTDLVISSCIDSLCVNNLSVVDMSISGSLSAEDAIINGSLTIPSLTPAGVVHNNASGLFTSSLIVNADVAPGAGIVDTKLATISTAGKVANSATTATSANTPNTIVLRDGAGNFSAGTITAALNGNATTATTATTATNATNFTGSLSGDVTGTQGATVVSFVGGQTAANVAAATVLANAATSANTANAIVRRDASGNFSAGTITASLTGNVTGNVTGGTVSATTLSTSGLATLASLSVTGDETVS